MKKPKSDAQKVAWRVEIYSMSCIVFAESKPKARWLAVKGYWDAGYGNKKIWPRPSATRTEQYDHIPLGNLPDRIWAEDYVRDVIK